MDGVCLYVPVVLTGKPDRGLPKHRVLREDSEFSGALRPEEQDLRDMIVMQSMDVLLHIREVVAPAVKEADQAFPQRVRSGGAYFSFELEPLAEPFPAPALILTGCFDNWCGYQDAYAILDSFPRATFAVLDCAGHALSVEQPALFGALVSEWLDRVEAYPPPK